jgi:hypothetical protein
VLDQRVIDDDYVMAHGGWLCYRSP